jgi:hypothetical protein
MEEKKMARTTGMASLEQKIEKAQMDVVKTKTKYEDAVSALKGLMDKRDAIRRDELISAIAKSGKSYEEIIRFISSKTTDE